MTGRILSERLSNGVTVLTVENPRKLNAMSLSMWQEMHKLVEAMSQDTGVRALVIRGAGEQAFVSGADISEFDRTRSPSSASEIYDQAIDGAFIALSNAPFPVIACIRGICMGGGIGLAIAADLRYCDNGARFRIPAARLGLGYGSTGMAQIVKVLGPAKAADLLFTARIFDGLEAERIGLVHKAFSIDTYEQECSKLIDMIADNAPLTVRLAKQSIRLSCYELDPEDARVIETGRRLCLESADYAEGRRAFAEKRTPAFLGR